MRLQILVPMERWWEDFSEAVKHTQNVLELWFNWRNSCFPQTNQIPWIRWKKFLNQWNSLQQIGDHYLTFVWWGGNDPETSHKLGMCMYIGILSVFVYHDCTDQIKFKINCRSSPAWTYCSYPFKPWLSTQIPSIKHVFVYNSSAYRILCAKLTGDIQPNL